MSEVITSRSNERVKYVRSLRAARIRRRQRAYMVEGIRLVEEALRAGSQPLLTLIVPDQLRRSARGERLVQQLDGPTCFSVTERVLNWVTDTVSPQGVIAVLPIQEHRIPAEPGYLKLVLDGIRDPGNLGSILRTAEASGIVRTVLLIDCADAYSPKVVRAGAGAHFGLCLVDDLTWADIAIRLESRPIRLATAGGGIAYETVDWVVESALIVGGEAEGASAEARDLATDLITIPMAGRAESLNASVAASIIIFEVVRQRRQLAA